MVALRKLLGKKRNDGVLLRLAATHGKAFSRGMLPWELYEDGRDWFGGERWALFL